MSHFTPLPALGGGILIGLSAAIMWLGLGRIAGISGMLAGIVTADWRWRCAFLAGMIAAPLIVRVAVPGFAATVPSAATPVIILGGLLVGFGTRLGGGCTSGHGVCGMARLSPRSIAATVIFMAAAMATVFVTHHLVRM